MLRQRRAQAPAVRAAASERIAARLLNSPAWAAAVTVVAYMSLPDEVATQALLTAALAQGKHVVLPVARAGVLTWYAVPGLDRSLFTPGAFGIAEPRATLPQWQPQAAATPVMWLVPGVAFDRTGRRLGRGAGYYDRALRAAGAVHGTIGLAFAGQLCDHVPAEDHDWTLESVVTPEEWVQCRGTS